MCKLFKRTPAADLFPKPTGYPVYRVYYGEVVQTLENFGLERMIKDWFKDDYEVLFTDMASWAEIAPFLISPADRYVEEGCDCDDYTRMARAKASFDFGLNGCFHCEGDTREGPHAWNLVLIHPRAYLLFEPNAGFPFAGELFMPQEHGYNPRSWK